jgi:hypothetical protein
MCGRLGGWRVSLRVFLMWGPRWSGVSSTIYDDEPWRHGATGYRRRTQDDGRAQDGGVVYHHDSINDRPGKVYALIRLGDWFTEDRGSNLSSVYAGVC